MSAGPSPVDWRTLQTSMSEFLEFSFPEIQINFDQKTQSMLGNALIPATLSEIDNDHSELNFRADNIITNLDLILSAMGEGVTG